MQDHRYSIDIEATPQEIWAIFWSRRNVEMEDVRIEILHKGDADGNGLVRRTWFKVPRYLLSGGWARSWEWLTEVRPYESWRYDAVGKPLYSEATGWTRLEDLGNGRTRVHFRETYHVFNPVLRVLLERHIHAYLSRDNDTRIKAAVERGVAAMRKRAGSA